MFACTAARRVFSRSAVNLGESLVDLPKCYKEVQEGLEKIQAVQMMRVVVQYDLSKLPEKERNVAQWRIADYMAAGHISTTGEEEEGEMELSLLLKKPPGELRGYARREAAELEKRIAKQLLLRHLNPIKK